VHAVVELHSDAALEKRLISLDNENGSSSTVRAPNQTGSEMITLGEQR
jgi:hypothetical protein